MAVLSESTASLRFSGDALDPDEVTALLGGPPTLGARRGEPTRRTPAAAAVPARTGFWRLTASPRTPGNLDARVADPLGGLTPDLAAWQDLCGRFRADLFCGLLMERSNEGLRLSARTLQALGERGLELDLDIYGPIGDASD
jgi:hypothetical protein